MIVDNVAELPGVPGGGAAGQTTQPGTEKRRVETSLFLTFGTNSIKLEIEMKYGWAISIILDIGG